MEAILHVLEEIVEMTAKIGITLVEMVGILVLLITVARSVHGYLTNDEHIRLKLAQGIALSLEFKLGGEVLRTVIARNWNELATLGAIIALRGALSLLLHWEIKTEEERAGRKIIDAPDLIEEEKVDNAISK